jgi:hypothetical protein
LNKLFHRTGIALNILISNYTPYSILIFISFRPVNSQSVLGRLLPTGSTLKVTGSRSCVALKGT